jgi:hypothetical protein
MNKPENCKYKECHNCKERQNCQPRITAEEEFDRALARDDKIQAHELRRKWNNI